MIQKREKAVTVINIAVGTGIIPELIRMAGNIKSMGNLYLRKGILCRNAQEQVASHKA